MKIEVDSVNAMTKFGEQLGRLVVGGTVIELRGDVGAGKTTLVKGMGRGMLIDEDISSPTFTIGRVYDARDNLVLAHYDFYRLPDPGIMADELAETIGDAVTVTVVEWAGVVEGVLPDDRLILTIVPPTETSRSIDLGVGGPISQHLLEQLT